MIRSYKFDDVRGVYFGNFVIILHNLRWSVRAHGYKWLLGFGFVNCDDVFVVYTPIFSIEYWRR